MKKTKIVDTVRQEAAGHVVLGGYASRGIRCPKSGGAPPHSKTLRDSEVTGSRASVLECAGAPAAFGVYSGRRGGPFPLVGTLGNCLPLGAV